MREVLFKAGISFVSLESAEKNLKAEIKDCGFLERWIRIRARSSLWDTALAKMDVSGGTDEQKVIFYTSLYHTMIDPRIYTDVDGQYMAALDGKAHKSGVRSRNVRSLAVGTFSVARCLCKRLLIRHWSAIC